MSAKTEKKIRKMYNKELNKVAGKDFDLYAKLMSKTVTRFKIAVWVLTVMVAVCLGIIVWG